MTLHLYSCDQSSSQQWPAEHWESTHSCLSTTAQVHVDTNDLHLKHKLRRSRSDPGLTSSTVTLELNAQHELRRLRNDPSLDDSIENSEHSASDSLRDLNFPQPEKDYPSPCAGNMETIWTSNSENANIDSVYYDDEAVNLDGYYYDDEDTKSQIFPFQKCSLRFHGLLFLILIYAAGYIAYVIVSPPKRRCQRPPTTVPPVLML